MSIEIPDCKTPVTKEELIPAMWKAWMAYFGSVPKKESIWVIVGQIVLETGLKYCHNYNLGNAKSRDGDGYDYQFFGCGEEVPLSMANAWKAKDPGLVTIKRIYGASGKQMASVWVDPPHWVSRFRAFHDLFEGATDHIALLVRRFTIAWEGIERGDPALFGHLLKQQGYFTDDETSYVKKLVGTYTMVSKMAFDYDSLPVLTEAEKERISNLVSLALQPLTDDIFSCPNSDPDEPNA